MAVWVWCTKDCFHDGNDTSGGRYGQWPEQERHTWLTLSQPIPLFNFHRPTEFEIVSMHKEKPPSPRHIPYVENSEFTIPCGLYPTMPSVVDGSYKKIIADF